MERGTFKVKSISWNRSPCGAICVESAVGRGLSVTFGKLKRCLTLWTTFGRVFNTAGNTKAGAGWTLFPMGLFWWPRLLSMRWSSLCGFSISVWKCISGWFSLYWDSRSYQVESISGWTGIVFPIWIRFRKPVVSIVDTPMDYSNTLLELQPKQKKCSVPSNTKAAGSFIHRLITLILLRMEMLRNSKEKWVSNGHAMRAFPFDVITWVRSGKTPHALLLVLRLLCTFYTFSGRFWGNMWINANWLGKLEGSMPLAICGYEKAYALILDWRCEIDWTTLESVIVNRWIGLIITTCFIFKRWLERGALHVIPRAFRSRQTKNR